jgi:formylglycine-generating enzyme required for sulfatase activity
MLRASGKLIPHTILAGALHCALIFASPNLSALAADGSDNAIRLQGEKISTEGFFQFFFEASAGQSYPVGVSTDLLHWTLLTNVAGAGGPLWFEDKDGSKFQRRFYHIGLPSTSVPIPITNMVFISPGTFTRGSPESEEGRGSDEGPQTVVTISRGFWMGKFEVTQAEYVSLMGSNIALLTYDTRLPLDLANWIHATNYCHQLTERERAAGHLPSGYGYRLPTEAEWEYACRAGTTTPFSLGSGTSLSSTQANFDGTFPYGGAVTGPYINRTTLGGSGPPNAWGLHDMHGNVWEWCQDWYAPYPGGELTDPKGPPTGTTRVLRGGGYTSIGAGCRSAKRDSRSPTYRNSIQGFRVVLAADPTSP